MSWLTPSAVTDLVLANAFALTKIETAQTGIKTFTCTLMN